MCGICNGTLCIVPADSFDESEHIPFKAKCHSGVRAWTLGTSFLHHQNRYSQNHGQCVEELTLRSLYFSPVSPSNPFICFPANILGERSPLRGTKREMRGRKDVCTLTEPLDFPKAFPANAFLLQALLSQPGYSCSLTWFPHSYLKDALFLIILYSQNNGMLSPLPLCAFP